MRSIVMQADPTIQAKPGSCPMLEWLPIEKLVVDETYQRDLQRNNWKAIRAIAEKFRWSRFSPVFCAPVEGGRFAIIDGQHRVHAAALCGIDAVPCQIVQMDRAEQAEAFAAVNGEVTAITTWNIFRAELAAGHEKAVALCRAVEAAGCKMATSNGSKATKKAGTIYFLAAARELHTKYGDRLTQALSIFLKCNGFDDSAELWAANIMHPMLEALCSAPPFIAHPAIVTAIDDFDVWATVDDLEAERRRRRSLGLPLVSGKEMLREAFFKHLAAELSPARVSVKAAKTA